MDEKLLAFLKEIQEKQKEKDVHVTLFIESSVLIGKCIKVSSDFETVTIVDFTHNGRHILGGELTIFTNKIDGWSMKLLNKS